METSRPVLLSRPSSSDVASAATDPALRQLDQSSKRREHSDAVAQWIACTSAWSWTGGPQATCSDNAQTQQSATVQRSSMSAASASTYSAHRQRHAAPPAAAGPRHPGHPPPYAHAPAMRPPAKFAFLLNDRTLADTQMVVRRLQVQAHKAARLTPSFSTPAPSTSAKDNVWAIRRRGNAAAAPEAEAAASHASSSDPTPVATGAGTLPTIATDPPDNTFSGSSSSGTGSCASSAAGADEQAQRHEQQQLLDTFTMHSTVLCANSPYFRSKLFSQLQTVQLNPRPRASTTASSGPDDAPKPAANTEGIKLLLEERMMPADLPALRSVLRFMYTEDLEYQHGVHSPASLMTLLRIADRFKVTDCVSACRREFSKLRVSDIDLEVLRMVYSIDAIVNDPSSFTEMITAVQERLLEMFKDVVTVIRSPSLLSQFLTLPFAAVAALLRSDRLEVDSENSVVALATLWVVRSRHGPRCTAEQRHYLSSCIRLALLSPSYLCGVLPNLKWAKFTEPGAVSAYFFHAVQSRLAESAGSFALLQGPQCSPRPSPSALPMRPRSPVASQNLEILLEIDQDSLEGYLTASSRGGQPPPSPMPLSGEPLGVGASSSRPPLQPAPSGSGGAFAGSGSRGAGTVQGEPEPPGSPASPPFTSGPGAPSAPSGPTRGVQVSSETSFFCGYLFGAKLLFGRPAGPAAPLPAGGGGGSGAPSTTGPGRSISMLATGKAGDREPQQRQQQQQQQQHAGSDCAAAAFTVTPSVFVTLPPGEEGILPLTCPISVCFHCCLEALGPRGRPFAAASFTGGSFMKPGEAATSSVAVANFFRRVPQPQSELSSWRPFLCDGKLRLRLTVQGQAVE